MNNSLEFHPEDVQASVSELVDILNHLRKDQEELSGILERLRTGNTELPYLDIEQFVGEVEEALDEGTLYIEAVERTIRYKVLSSSNRRTRRVSG